MLKKLIIFINKYNVQYNNILTALVYYNKFKLVQFVIKYQFPIIDDNSLRWCFINKNFKILKLLINYNNIYITSYLDAYYNNILLFNKRKMFIYYVFYISNITKEFNNLNFEFAIRYKIPTIIYYYIFRGFRDIRINIYIYYLKLHIIRYLIREVFDVSYYDLYLNNTIIDYCY